MPATPEELFAYLARIGITVETVSHPPLRTVEDAKAHRRELAGGQTKNLFLKDRKGALFLVVAPEDGMIDLKRIHEVIGAQGKVSFGSAEVLERVWGVVPGAVTALGAINDYAGEVTVVLDTALLANERVCCHPLVNTMTSAIGREDLLKFLRATGHEPLVLPISSADAVDE